MISEAELQDNVLGLCAKLRLFVYHSRDSRRNVGAGFPDLVIVGKRILYRELKAHGRRLRPEQVRWGYRITAAGGDFEGWWPTDWASGRIEQQLTCAATEEALR